ncbi:F-box protein [Capsicum annuum]|uniref:F-box protein n=1 Tax=Capsicum annuum TaxID=4072 RepID=A0A2G2YAR6_CAPAN|nr:putative cytochrome 84A1-like isoform 1 [Capsicum annuum]PHT66820.1 F-box protein [Capsicum annuum]
MDYFQLLPEGCVSNILSFTSPKDVAISSATSWGFNSAAESDVIWNKFLPDDYEDVISRYVSPQIFPSKKELYFSLRDSAILIDGGKLSFSLEKKTGKKCFMISARELAISWGVDTPWYWEWISHPDSRFVNHVSDQEAEQRASVISLVEKMVRRRKRNVKRPRKRSDGWMEVELGNFFNDLGEDGDIEARLMEISGFMEKVTLLFKELSLDQHEEEIVQSYNIAYVFS